MNAGPGGQDPCQRVPAVVLSVSVWCQVPAGQPNSPAQGAAAEPSPCIFRPDQLPASCGTHDRADLVTQRGQGLFTMK